MLRTEDGGRTWHRVAPPPGAADLDFRDVEAWDARRALLMSAGTGAASGLWRTGDGGGAWRKVLDCPWPDGFFDAIAFWNERDGLLVGDPVDGGLLILRTADGGDNWSRPRLVPRTAPGEYVFAASGTGVCAGEGGRAWIGTGGEGGGRVWRSEDGGMTWAAADTPLAQGRESAGIFSIAFADARHGVIVGGDWMRPQESARTAAFSEDGGLTWTLSELPPGGYRSCVARTEAGGWICTGPDGTDASADGGRTWQPVGAGFHAVHRSFAAGAGGAPRRLLPDQGR